MKRLALTVLLIFIISTIPMTSFAEDNIEFNDSKYSEAFTFITGSYDRSCPTLSIWGYIDHVFKPNDNVYRNVFVRGLCNLLDLYYGICSIENELDIDYHKIFGDIDDIEWESGIKDIYNYDKDILRGFPDGSFKGNVIIKYEEAVTMMVRALGYEKEMESRLYPKDYLTKACEIGLLDNIEAEIGEDASFGIVSQLFFNSFKVELKPEPLCFEIYKDVTVILIDSNNEIIKCKDNEGAIEVFKYDYSFCAEKLEALKDKKVTLWVYLFEDGKDMLIRGESHYKINDCIIRIVEGK